MNDVQATVVIEDISPMSSLSIGTIVLALYVPVSSWTMEKQGSRRGAKAGVENKRQVNEVLVAPSSHFKYTYIDKTLCCLSLYKLPAD